MWHRSAVDCGGAFNDDFIYNFTVYCSVYWRERVVNINRYWAKLPVKYGGNFSEIEWPIGQFSAPSCVMLPAGLEVLAGWSATKWLSGIIQTAFEDLLHPDMVPRRFVTFSLNIAAPTIKIILLTYFYARSAASRRRRRQKKQRNTHKNTKPDYTVSQNRSQRFHNIVHV